MIGPFGHYEIKEKIGKGGMGEVYRAHDTTLDRDVAIKVLPEDVASDPQRVARFQREAKAVAALQHPNIVTIHSVEQIEGRTCITMELVSGKTLADLIPHGGMPLERFFELAIPLAEATLPFRRRYREDVDENTALAARERPRAGPRRLHHGG